MRFSARTAFAHKHGIRVGGYVGATMMYESFFREEPAARGWIQTDENGRPVYYSYSASQTFRYAACRNNPGYRAFIEKVLRLGVQDIKLDMIHFDQMHWWSERRGFSGWNVTLSRASFDKLREYLSASTSKRCW